MILPNPLFSEIMPPNVPIWTVLPFCLLLGTIALGPILFHKKWEHEKTKLITIFVLSIPVIFIEFMQGKTGVTKIWHSLGEFVSFFSLISSLYIVASGFVFRVKWQHGVISNAILLFIALASTNILGTTGSSILFFKPFLHLNQSRVTKVHLVVFYILMVGNTGGLLTPLGDPPLFIGYLNGIDFFWTTKLFPQWLVANLYLLGLFCIVDFILWKKERHLISHPEDMQDKFIFSGERNLFWLLIIILTVLFQSPDFAGSRFLGASLGIKDFHVPALFAAFVQLATAFLSFKWTPKLIHTTNLFTWEPVKEIGILFLGIFLTMIPALDYLRLHGEELGIHHPWQYFLVTGGLSSLLDNAPTYLAFCVIGAGNSPISSLPVNQPLVLSAICCGAVFMGANTYIGNGPNFLTKALAEKEGIRMPNFFTYSFYALIILSPLYFLLTWLFFWPS